MSEEYKSHPSYVTIILGKISSGGDGFTLFGSKVKHRSFISLRIQEASIREDGFSEHIFPRKSIIEVFLSEGNYILDSPMRHIKRVRIKTLCLICIALILWLSNDSQRVGEFGGHTVVRQYPLKLLDNSSGQRIVETNLSRDNLSESPLHIRIHSFQCRDDIERNLVGNAWRQRVSLAQHIYSRFWVASEAKFHASESEQRGGRIRQVKCYLYRSIFPIKRVTTRPAFKDDPLLQRNLLQPDAASGFFHSVSSLNGLPTVNKEGQECSPNNDTIGPCEVSGLYWRAVGVLGVFIGFFIAVLSDRSRLSLSCAVFAALLGVFCILGHTNDCDHKRTYSNQRPISLEGAVTSVAHDSNVP